MLEKIIAKIDAVHGIKCAPILVDKRLAEECCDSVYEGQRTYSPVGQKRHSAILESGYWLPGSQFRVSWDGEKYVVTDGQHRLRAIKDSGISAVMTIVVSGLNPEEDCKRSDMSGKPRKVGDVLKACGIGADWRPNFRNSYGSACRLLQSLFDFDGQSRSTMSSASIADECGRQYVEEMETYKRIYDSTEKNRGTASGIFRTGVLAVALATIEGRQEKAIEFWTRVFQDDGLRNGSGEYMLSRWMISAKSMNRGASQSIPLASINAARAWNWFYSGSKPTHKGGCKPYEPKDGDAKWKDQWCGILGTKFEK